MFQMFRKGELVQYLKKKKKKLYIIMTREKGCFIAFDFMSMHMNMLKISKCFSLCSHYIQIHKCRIIDRNKLAPDHEMTHLFIL